VGGMRVVVGRRGHVFLAKEWPEGGMHFCVEIF
jgi:hypothetical protein